MIIYKMGKQFIFGNIEVEKKKFTATKTKF